jgi:hypothetical protein
MSNGFNFDANAAFGPADKIARKQEDQSRLLLWDLISEKAASNEQFRQQLTKNPEQVIRQEAGVLANVTGQQLDVSKDTVDKLAEKAIKTFSVFMPQIGQDRVEELIFGTIEDMRTSFKLTLRLSQVLFYSGLVMVAVAFVVALTAAEKLVPLLFGAGGLANVLLSSLVLSPLNRVQDSAGDLVQLQMAYLAYYKQLSLLGGSSQEMSRDDAIAFSREIDRAALSLISSVQSNVERGDSQRTSDSPAHEPAKPKSQADGM